MKTKKRIALEIIIFFSSLLFLAISFSLLSVWNKFKENQINEYSKKIEKLDSRIKLLETNLKYKFIPFENYTAKLLYKLYQEEKIISRKTSFEQFENSDDFLIKGLYKDGIRKGFFKTIDYTCFSNAWNDSLLEKKKSYNSKSKDTIVNEEYFSNQLDDYILLLITKNHTDNQIIKLSKKFKQDRIIRNDEINILTREMKSIKEKIKIGKNSKFDKTNVIIYLSSFLFITVYPLRLFYFLILWSLKTLKE